MRVGIEAALAGESWARIHVMISGGRDGITSGEAIVVGLAVDGPGEGEGASHGLLPTFDSTNHSF